jgi:transposase
VADRLRTHPGYTAIRVIPGVGPILAAVFVAEIGDITRFGGPEQLASWAGLTPKHHESDTTVHRGRITKQGWKNCDIHGHPTPTAWLLGEQADQIGWIDRSMQR